VESDVAGGWVVCLINWWMIVSVVLDSALQGVPLSSATCSFVHHLGFRVYLVVPSLNLCYSGYPWPKRMVEQIG